MKKQLPAAAQLTSGGASQTKCHGPKSVILTTIANRKWIAKLLLAWNQTGKQGSFI